MTPVQIDFLQDLFIIVVLIAVVGFALIAIAVSSERKMPGCDCNHNCNQGRDCPLRKGV